METNFVITGVGLLGDWGAGKENLMRFLSGSCSHTPIEKVDFDAYIDTSLVRRADYISRCALIAAKFALEDAGLLPVCKEKSNRVGVVLGTVNGGLHYTVEYHASLVKGDPKLASPLLFSESVANAAASHICTILGIRGYSTTVPGYCGVTQALQLGAELIQQGVIDVCIIGGADVNHDFLTKAYSACLPNPELITNNFGGSGFLVIEALTHAIQRKAKIYAQLEGVRVITAQYAIAKRCDVSPLQELLCEADSELKDHDCLISASYNEKDSLQRRDLFIKAFKHQQRVDIDCSDSFGYGFSAAEAFQLILGVLGVFSPNYLASFKEFANVKTYIDRIFVMRTTLAGANACVLFSHYSPSED